MTGRFVHLDVPTLTTMLAAWQGALNAIAVGNQSYTIAGRTFTRANAAEVGDMIGEIAFAIKLNGGGLVRTVYSDLSY